MDYGRPHTISQGSTYKSMCARVPSSTIGPPPPPSSVPVAAPLSSSLPPPSSAPSTSSSTAPASTAAPAAAPATTLPEIMYENLVQSNAALDDIFDAGQDHTSYLESHIERSDVISEGALVVIFESFDSLSFDYVKRGGVIQNRNGTFYHDDMIGKEFGIKLCSRSTDGYVYCLRPTSELWTRSLPHRTQICHELDQSVVVFNLDLRPGSIVLESGTGSGAMSTSIMRAIAPTGRLHSHEFNERRVLDARLEFERNGLGHLASVYHRDVCGKLDGEEGGFCGVADGTADAVFLDLPEPWLAVKHAHRAMKVNGRLCSYSPCIEQTQRCSQALEKSGFHSLKTIEVRLKEYHVDEVEVELPDCTMPFYYGVSAIEKNKKMTEAKSGGGGTRDKGGKRKAAGGGPPASTDGRGSGSSGGGAVTKKLYTRPFSEMRGHTAFLTFATKSCS